MKQVLKTIESLILNSKYQLGILLTGTVIIISSCQKEEIQSSSQKQDLLSRSQKEEFQSSSQNQDFLNISQKQNQQEKSVPFKGKMTLIVKSNTVSGTGTATHIGRFTIVEPNNSIKRNADGSLTITGTAIITAANGDEIHATHSGSVYFLRIGMVQVNAEFTIMGGTGRFAGATGSFEVQNLTNPGDYTFNGTISY
jgi:hypothetical protein